MKEDKIDILISKYLNNSCTPEEKVQVEKWKAAEKANQRYFEQFEKVESLLSEMDFVAEPETDQEWQKLRNEIETSAESKQEAKVRSLPAYKKYLSIAAAFAALVVIGWLLLPQFYSSTPGIAQEYTIPKGETKSVALPDGSTVNLNADSYLAVIEGFSEKERRVRLQGEAYFEIARNPEKPFIVETEKARTQVLGTAFNLRAYPESEQIRLSVTEGRVAFRTDDLEGVVLTANKAASFDKSTQTFQVETYEQGTATAWLTGGLYFKDASLSTIFRELERRFDVTIQNESGLGEEAYSVELEQVDSVTTLLDLIAISFSVSYTQQGKVITIKPQ